MTTLFSALLDDAAVFPPGDLPLAEAVPAHQRHRQASYADLVGSFVLAARDLGDLARLVDGAEAGSLALTMTVPLPVIREALAAADAIPAVRLTGLEVALPDDVVVADLVPAIDAARADSDFAVYVEIPRDDRRERLIAALSGTSCRAKLRTGGVRADLYPDERELAHAILALGRAGVPFKATAGLHHPLRNTDPSTGFEQHGFLNVLLAAGAATAGADVKDLVSILGERDPDQVVAAVRRLDPAIRDAFHSFGTCSITEPVDELHALGLLEPSAEAVR